MEPYKYKCMPTVEYFILMGMVVAIILLSLNETHFPRARVTSGDTFAKIGIDIAGPAAVNVNFASHYVPSAKDCLPTGRWEEATLISFFPCENKTCFSRINEPVTCTIAQE